jgi:hypothetical protein
LDADAASDAGSNAAAAALPFDQRGIGFPRVAGGSVDIGAYEAFADRVFVGDFEPGT